MLKPFRYHIIILIALLVGAIVLQYLVNSHYKSLNHLHQDRLVNSHNSAILRAKAGIDVYATLVSSIRSYVKNSSDFPTENQLQNFLKDLLTELSFKDSIVVSFLNTDHKFIYVFSPTQIDEASLKGRIAEDFRPKEEISKLNDLMQNDNILLFDPVNLHEGWAGFPFNFSVKDPQGKPLGYMAPIINVKYLLNYFYPPGDNDLIHYFEVNHSFYISREAVFDGTPIFNPNKDDQYFKNFNTDQKKFISTNIDLFGLNLEIGSAFKNEPEIQSTLILISYVWYAALLGFFIITLIQFFRNYSLNKKLNEANSQIELKNILLEKRVNHVQTLIKEIHHRIKNNMMMITTLIDLESQDYKEPKIKKALEQIKTRIKSMSLIHEKLYGNDSLEYVFVQDYLKKLLSYIDQSFNNTAREIKKEIKIPSDLDFDEDTILPLGLLLNELITNSYKYVFRSDLENRLSIEIKKNNDGYILFYDDNGPGIPDSLDLTNTSSLGLQLIKILAEELHGSVIYKKDASSRFEITFKPKFTIKNKA